MIKFGARRRSFFFGLIIALIVVYANLIEPNWLEITQTNIGQVDQSPIVIAQISDLHMQHVGGIENAVIRSIKEIQPDILVMSGDIIDKTDSLALLDQLLVDLSGVNKVAVLGNWEYWSDVDLKKLQMVYAAHGVKLLVNEAARIKVKGRNVVIHGIDDFTAGKPRLPKLSASDNDLSILVQHSPAFFDESLDDLGKVSLCLSGHTHGGQISVFGWAPWRPPGSGRYTRGLYQTATCPLYVSRGVGTSILSFRIGSRPEVAVFGI